MQNKKHLVIGLGEVGEALQKILRCDGHDPIKEIYNEDGEYDVLHIAFPFSETFIDDVKKYETQFKSGLTIIHSTVPLGTTDALGAVHSPIRGPHPHLVQGIETFVKYFGGARAEEAAEYFKALSIGCTCVPNAKTTEALKLWDTTQYGIMILLNKQIMKFCEETGTDFGIIYGHANQTYNEGYNALGRPEVIRPYLNFVPGPIGGHCVLPNAGLLGDYPFATMILEAQKQLEEYYAENK